MGIGINIDILTPLQEKIAATTAYIRDTVPPQAQAWAKKNHPTWKTHTGKGEAAISVVGGENVKGPFFVIKNKQGWRETKDNGKNGVCRKTLDHFLPIINKELVRIWS